MPDSILLKDRVEFLEIVSNFITSDYECLKLNFKNTNAIDSAGLGFLLIALQEAKNNNKELVLESPNEYINKIFQKMNFYDMFTIELTEEN